MKYSVAAVLAVAAGASAQYGGNATVVTEVVDVYTTYCPGPTQITHGSKTYTVTAPTTLTITDCPCTITKPIMTTSAVICHTCAGNYNNGTGTGTMVNPTATPPSATVIPPGATATGPAGTNPGATQAPTAVPTAGASKVAIFSGAGLAGVVGLAAFML
ncbi:hypothetical protein L249_1554 [Ophiocordyceps polyrhachis-furcata BCC 54312]|uniref:Mmc protein n=1 Tax=Ophiocordyceps polyrhachis-furcata BCC 54312 TaxID=1330021 RepID=A0A367L4G3_9HYPO|nr:hypothetical protein L249_1554 [Ophiocordyceps polyrhachis-furcata BCC 54312]